MDVVGMPMDFSGLSELDQVRLPPGNLDVEIDDKLDDIQKSIFDEDNSEFDLLDGKYADLLDGVNGDIFSYFFEEEVVEETECVVSYAFDLDRHKL